MSWWTAWLSAFAFTQAVEVPVDACALARHGPHRARWKRAVIGFGASAVTHPVVWFVFPRLARRWGQGYAVMVVEAETFAVVVEAAYLGAFGLRHALLWSIVANAASAGLGLVMRHLVGWP